MAELKVTPEILALLTAKATGESETHDVPLPTAILRARQELKSGHPEPLQTSVDPPAISDVGVVVCGHNDADCLPRCIESLARFGLTVVYADGRSIDASVEIARSLGVDVVEASPSGPPSVIGSLDSGLQRLLATAPGTRFVQVVLADSELNDGWIERARGEFDAQPNMAVLCGQIRNRLSERSVYSRMFEIEHNTPVGETTNCDINAMIRVNALEALGGFSSPSSPNDMFDLCERLRHKGWTSARLDSVMLEFGVGISTFFSWWRIAVGFRPMAYKRVKTSELLRSVWRVRRQISTSNLLALFALVVIAKHAHVVGHIIASLSGNIGGRTRPVEYPVGEFHGMWDVR